MGLKSLVGSIRSRLRPTKVAAQTTPEQNGVEGGGPIRFSSRLKDGRALAQDVWTIYKFVLVTCATPLNCLANSYIVVAVLRISQRTASISARGT